jgi:hypothetical protein
MINTTLTSQIIKTISVSMKTDRIKPCGAAMRRQRHLYGLMFFVYFATVPKFFPLLYRNIYCIWLIYPSDSQPGQIFLFHQCPEQSKFFTSFWTTLGIVLYLRQRYDKHNPYFINYIKPNSVSDQAGFIRPRMHSCGHKYRSAWICL